MDLQVSTSLANHEMDAPRRLDLGGREPIGLPDGALQRNPGPPIHGTKGLSFEGLTAANSGGYAPPDTNGSVGDTQYVEIVNVDYAVFDKTTGSMTFGPFAIHTIWTGFSGDCASGDGGDPVVLYDKAAARWVLGQLNVNYNAYCLAISTSSDATGSWARYEFQMFSGQLPDYPKVSVWPDAYYFTANIFGNGAAEACAFDRANMLSGGAANAICFPQKLPVFSLLPSDLDGSTPPPTGEPNFMIYFAAPSTLNLYKFHVDFVNTNNSTFTGSTKLTVANFTEGCQGGTCIPQKGTTNTLDSLGDRLMFRLAYRNLGTSENLVVTHTVKAGTGSSQQTGSRWYLIQDPNGTATVAQQGTYSPDTTHYRWMSSAAMDKTGDIGMGYSVSSSTIFPSIRFTGRQPSDPLNTMEAEATVVNGTGDQNGGLNRWGDYSSMSIDPSDDCTFWYTQEYLKTTGSFNWNLRPCDRRWRHSGG